MATKYFRGLADNKWSNDLNWSTTSGGGNDTTKAVAGDDAIMEADVHIDTTEACLSFTQTGNNSPTFDGALNVSGDFSITDINGLEGTGTVNVQGDFTYTDAASQGNTISFILDGTGAQNLDWSGSASAIEFNLEINKASGTVTNVSDMNASGTGVARLRLTMTAGTFDGNGFICRYYQLKVDGGTYNCGSGDQEYTIAMLQTGGVFNGDDSHVKFSDDCIISGGTFNASTDRLDFKKSSNSIFQRTAGTFNHNNGLIITTGNHFDLDLNGQDVFNCESNFNNESTIWQFLSQTVIRGDFIQTKGAFTTDDITIDLHGDFKVGSSQGGVGSLRFNMVGTGDQDIYYDKLGGSGRTGAGIIVNKPSGTLTFYDTIGLRITNFATILEYVAGTVVFNTGFILRDIGYKAVYDWDGGPRVPAIEAQKLNPSTGMTLNSNLDVENFTNLGMGPLDGVGVLDVSGNISQDNSMIGSAQVTLTGTANQTIDAQGFSFGGGVFAINKTSGTVTLLSDFNNSVSGSDFFMISGTLDTTGFAFSLHDQLVQTGGLITGSGVFTAGRYVLTAGTIDVNVAISLTTTSGTIFSDSAGFNFDVESFLFKGANHWDVQQFHTTFQDMAIDKCPTCNYTGTQTIDGTLTVFNVGGFQSGSQTTLNGDLVGTGGVNQTGVGKFIFKGTAAQSVNTSMRLPDVEIDKASGILTFETSTQFAAGYNVLNGAVDWTTNQSGALFELGNNTHTITTDGQQFYNFSIDKTGSSKFVLLDDVFVANSFFVSDATGSLELSGFSISVRGDVLVLEQNLSGSTVIKMTGNQNATFIQQYSDWFNSDLVLEKTSGTVSLGSDVTLPLDFDLNDGVFCTNEFDLTAVNIKIDSNATFDKTPSSVLTGTVTGTVNDVEECEKKTNFLVAV